MLSGVISDTLSLERTLCSEDDLNFGECNSSKFEVEVSEIEDITGLKIRAYVKVTGYPDDIALFTGYVDSAKAQPERNARMIVAYDELHKYADMNVSEWYNSMFSATEKPEYQGAWDAKAKYTAGNVVKYGDAYYQYLCDENSRFSVVEQQDDGSERTQTYIAADYLIGKNPEEISGDENVSQYIQELEIYEPFNYGEVTVKTFRDSLFAHIGLQQADTVLINDDVYITKTLDTNELKFSDCIKAICQINAVFGHMSADGIFQYIPLGKDAEDYSGNYKATATTYEEFTVKAIDSVRLYGNAGDIAAVYGAGSNCWNISNNFLIYRLSENELKEAAKKLYETVHGITYTPVSLTALISMLPVMLGDKLQFTTHTGDNVTSFILRDYLSGMQLSSQVISANGNELRSSGLSQTDALGMLEAKTAAIEEKVYKKLAVDSAVIKTLSGNFLSFKTGEFESLKSKQADFETATAQNFSASNADIKKVSGDLADYKEVVAGKFTASEAQIQRVSGELADYKTVVSQEMITAKGWMLEGAIGSAQISDVNANKITAGTLNTALVDIAGTDGRMQISDNTIRIKDANRVRVQVGKDASGDYTLAVWDVSGKLIWDALGATENTIQRKIIRDKMVADDAAIQALKIDFQSFDTALTNQGVTISGTVIQVGSKTLNVVLSEQTQAIEGNTEKLSTQEAKIAANEKAIALRVTSQDFNSYKTTVTGDINTAKTEAVNAAASDATAKANKALSDAKTDAKTKADKALADAKTYTNTQITTVNKSLSTTNQEVSVMKGQIALKVEQTDIDSAVQSIKIGGRNLIKRTAYAYKSNGGLTISYSDDGYLTAKGTTTSAGNITLARLTDVTGLSGKYTFSCERVTGSDAAYCVTLYQDGTYKKTITLPVGKDSITFDGTGYDFGYISVVNTATSRAINIKVRFKLEKGTKATDWTPATEDTDAAINAVDAKFASYSTTTQMNSAINLAKTSITQSVSETYATKSQVNTVSGSVTSLTTRVSAAELKLTKDSLITTIGSYYTTKEYVGNAIDDIEIGGRNLLQNTKSLSGYGKSSSVTLSNDTDGFAAASFSAVTTLSWRDVENRPPIPFSLVRGKTVTFSLLVKSDDWEALNKDTSHGLHIVGALCTASSLSRTLYGTIRNGYATKLSNKWQKVTATVTLTDGFFKSGTGTIDDTTRFYVQVYNYSLYRMDVKQFKLEFGTKATDWTPATEDVAGDIADVKTVATQTAREIGWLVESGTNETNFTLTDRTATLISDIINLKGLVTFSGLDSTAQSKITTAQSTADTAKNNATTALNRATYHYAACDTAAGTAAKTVTLSGFSLYTGATVSVRFNNGNTAASPTLNVNGTGAKPIVINGTATPTAAQAKLAAWDTCTFVYDGSQWRLTGTDATVRTANNAQTAVDKIQTGLGIKWNYSAFATANDGEAYLCAYNQQTGALSDAAGWVMWNGVKRTIAKGMINPNSMCPFNKTIYIVCRLSSASATSGTNYLVWYNSGWKSGNISASTSATVSAWTWVEATDIVLGSFVEPASEGAFVDCILYNPCLKSSQVTAGDTAYVKAATAQSTANTAKTNAATAQSTANAAKVTADAADSAIAAWCYNNNRTYINGGKIYTKSIKAAQIDVADLFAQEITATGSITGAKLISKAEDSVRRTEIWNSYISFYKGSTRTGAIRPIAWGGDYADKEGVMFATESTYLAIASNSGSGYGAGYVLNNGLNPDGFTDKNIFYGNVRLFNSLVNVAGYTWGSSAGLGWYTSGGISTVKGILVGNTKYGDYMLQVKGDAYVSGTIREGGKLLSDKYALKADLSALQTTVSNHGTKLTDYVKTASFSVDNITIAKNGYTTISIPYTIPSGYSKVIAPVSHSVGSATDGGKNSSLCVVITTSINTSSKTVSLGIRNFQASYDAKIKVTCSILFSK